VGGAAVPVEHAPGLKLPPAELYQVRHHAVLALGLSVQAIRAHWCTFGLADAKLRGGGAPASPSPCRDGLRRSPLDGPRETSRAAGAGRSGRTTG
jgi:hypothetical protein